jgi:V8-like Glu-specific endopeptidase
VDWSRDAVINLREVLANNYPTVTDSRKLVVDVGLRPDRIEFDNKAINNWFNILEYAKKHPGKLDDIVKYALEEFPDDEALRSAEQGSPLPVLQVPKPGDWHGPLAASQLEKIIGAVSTLVAITYLEKGLVRAKSVARVRRADGSSGTGFLTDGNVLITNNHVLPDIATSGEAIAQFNYQHTVEGLSAPMEEYRFLPRKLFKTSIADDWTAVRVEGSPAKKWGTLKLEPAKPKVGDHVNIIQHAGGGPKQISFFANVVVFVGEGRIQYLTDTLPGSSGSPVFDPEWNVVALHHSGGWLHEPNAPKKTTYYRNEGILIDCIIAGLSN